MVLLGWLARKPTMLASSSLRRRRADCASGARAARLGSPHRPHRGGGWTAFRNLGLDLKWGHGSSSVRHMRRRRRVLSSVIRRRDALPAPQSKSLAPAPRLEARIALLVAFKLGPEFWPQGQHHARQYSYFGRLKQISLQLLQLPCATLPRDARLNRRSHHQVRRPGGGGPAGAAGCDGPTRRPGATARRGRGVRRPDAAAGCDGPTRPRGATARCDARVRRPGARARRTGSNLDRSGAPTTPRQIWPGERARSATHPRFGQSDPLLTRARPRATRARPNSTAGRPQAPAADPGHPAPRGAGHQPPTKIATQASAIRLSSCERLMQERRVRQGRARARARR